MSDPAHIHPPSQDPSPAEWIRAIQDRTPARILVGRAGTSYPTSTLLGLRLDHAAASDAVHAEIDLRRDLGDGLIEDWGLFEVATTASSKAEYLMRPDLGRRLGAPALGEIVARCPAEADLQVAIGDGLSAAAVVAQVPTLFPLLRELAEERGWRFGRLFFVRYCRVGVLNDIGEALRPRVVVLLIGERPGLATAESLSAYLAYRPGRGHTDARRNLISNIHARGVLPEDAARRIVALAEQMIRLEASGVAVKEP